jgi:hypothetical protein
MLACCEVLSSPRCSPFGARGGSARQRHLLPLRGKAVGKDPGTIPYVEKAMEMDKQKPMTLFRRLLHTATARLPVRIITAEIDGVEDGVPLFERYLVGRLPRFGRWGGGVIYLHHYLRSDPDDSLHDHPWNWGIALPLAGGYDEVRLAGFDTGGMRLKTTRRPPGRAYRLTGADFHRVVLHGPTSWSLFIHGPLTKAWGFLRPAAESNAATVRFDAPNNWDMDELRYWQAARRGRDVARAAP